MVPYAAATILLVVIAVAGAVGKLVLSYVSDRIGRIRIMMLCGVLTATGAALMVASQESAMLITAAIVFGIGEGTLWAVYAASARDLFPACCAGSVLGVWVHVSSCRVDIFSDYQWLVNRYDRQLSGHLCHGCLLFSGFLSAVGAIAAV